MDKLKTPAPASPENARMPEEVSVALNRTDGDKETLLAALKRARESIDQLTWVSAGVPTATTTINRELHQCRDDIDVVLKQFTTAPSPASPEAGGRG